MISCKSIVDDLLFDSSITATYINGTTTQFTGNICFGKGKRIFVFRHDLERSIIAYPGWVYAPPYNKQEKEYGPRWVNGSTM